MTEEKYEEKVLKALNLIVDQTKPPAPKPAESSEHVAMPESAKGHRTIDEVADCPNCKPKLLEKLRPEFLKEFREKLKSKELVTCSGCGEIVGKDERYCPTCHGTNAH